MRAAVVDTETNTVLNVIVADANSDPAPAGSFLINLEEETQCAPGWIFDPVAGTFTEPSATSIGG